MKKLIIFFIMILGFNTNIYAKERIEVKFSKCVDGDTANVLLDNEEIKLRFLAIDTPESVHPTIGEEEYGKEASEYTCKLLKSAKKIEIEYDSNSDKFDKYDRHLVWVFVDGNLLQEKIIENGLAEVAYLYEDYKYTSILEEKETIAKNRKIGIWSNSTNYLETIIAIIVIIACIILFFTNQKFRKKATNEIKKTAKKELKKVFKN